MRTHLELTGPFAAASASRAVRHGSHIYVSAVIGLGADGKIVAGGIAEETRAALADAKEILGELGASLSDIVSATVYLVDFSADYAEFSRVYGEHFSPPYPARATVQVAYLAMDARVEIQLVAIAEP